MKPQKEGDLKSFKQLFEKYYKLLSARAFYMLDDEMEAEDAVQNLFIDIWNKKLYLNINFSLKPYLHKAIHNRCLNIIQKKKADQKKAELYAYTLTELDHFDFTVEAPTEKLLMFSLETLPSRQYYAFNLVHIEDRRYKDAAQEMGISINSFKTHLKLAVRGIKKQLNGSGYNA